MRLNRNAPKTIWTNPIHFIACAFGFGALPWAPGTWATLATIPIIIALKHFPDWVYLLITFAMILAGIYVCGVTNRDFGTEDHPACAWDEMASFPLVMFIVPLTFWHVVIAVVLFRFFDILKPWPIRWLDRHIHGGLGVMLDDVVAAIFSWLIMQIVIRFI
jgi:phosphatidylglycerophosphatase A